jgi:hypothetical protein
MRHLWNTIALLAVGLIQCTSKAVDEPKYPDGNAYCRGRGEAECNDAVIAACALPSKDSCITKRQAVCNMEIPLGRVYDPSQAEACLAKVSEAYANAILTKPEIEAYQDACAPLFSGTGVKDSPCRVDEDCKLSDGYKCILMTIAAPDGGADGGETTVTGSCQVPKTVSGGDSCAEIDSFCPEGYHCGVQKYCIANSLEGQMCSESLPCKPTLKCSATGTCELKLPDSSSCMVDDDCTNDICLKSPTASSGLCVSQITLAPSEPFCTSAR